MHLQTWTQLQQSGHSLAEVRSLLRDGRLERVRRGVYGPVANLDAAPQHTRLVLATIGQIEAGAFVSHFSAAIVWGLPVPLDRIGRVWITRNGARANGRDAGHLRLVKAPVEHPDSQLLDGIPITGLARTTVDVLCRVDFRTGVAVADAALRFGATPDDLVDAAARCATARHIRRARTVIGFADARAESVGESQSRALMHLHGLPAPALQQAFHDERGLIGRVDFWWPHQHVVGEFDGRIKYGRELAPGGDPSEAVWREKQREDRLRRLVAGIERWVWADVMQPDAWLHRLERALA